MRHPKENMINFYGKIRVIDLYLISRVFCAKNKSLCIGSYIVPRVIFFPCSSEFDMSKWAHFIPQMVEAYPVFSNRGRL